MSEGEQRLFIIRNGCAVNAAHADGKWGDVEPLAVGAERNAAAAGLMIKTILGEVQPLEALCSPSRRSTQTLLQALGAAGFSTEIQTEVAFVHSGKPAPEVAQAVREKIQRLASRGPCVAVMSRRAILAGLFPEFRDNFGVSAAQVDQKPEGYEHDVIPPGSLIVVRYSERVKDIALERVYVAAQPQGQGRVSIGPEIDERQLVSA